MRKLVLFVFIVSLSIQVNAQQCNGVNQLVIHGAKNSGNFHQLQMSIMGSHSSDPSQTEILAEAWTCNGIGVPICNFRATLKYKLNAIPQNAVIVSANLFLYARTNSTNAYVGHPTYSNGGGNAVSIMRVTNNWDTTGVNYGWDDQTTTEQDSVVLPSSTNDAQDYVADIKNLVQFWVNNPDSNFGMQLKQIDETYYKSMIFHSGTSPAAQQPRLEICYYTEDNYPKVYGTAYYDANANNVFDSAEIIASYTKVTLSNGNVTYTDANGYYELATLPFGQYNVTATAPNFYTASNLVTNVSLNSFGQKILNDIGFVATSNTDSINIKIVPFHNWARLGWSYPFYIEYENLGNTNLTPSAIIYYDSLHMPFDSCNNPLVNNLGNQLLGNFSNIKPGERHHFLTYLYTKPTAPIGDTTQLFASISAGNASAYDEVDPVFSAAYDPNDIVATPKLSTQEVQNGKYIDYTIHFQNLGNDTAFNISVASQLSSLLQSNTVQVLAASHNCKTTIVNDLITFKFKNIKLPYKNINELKSMGFVRFRVKPKTTVIVGTDIPAKASVYFDYNPAVITNTAITKIANTTLPLTFVKYNITKQQSNIVNSWTTTNEINLSYFNIQRSINGKDFETIGKVNAGKNEYTFNDLLTTNSSLSTTLYYRIVAIDNDGKKMYSKTQSLNIEHSKFNITIYPNPVKNYLYVESTDKITSIKLFNELGIQVLQSNNMSNGINIKQLNKGIYIAQITIATNDIFNKKIIIE